MIGSFATYDRSPYAVLGKESFFPPRGLERVTRHPFFVGLALFAVAHALLATRLVGAVFEERLRETSTVPFAAILAGRQRLVWSELPFKAMAFGLLLTFGLRALHDGIFVWGGAPLILSTIGASGVILVLGLRRRHDRPGARLRGTVAQHDRAHA